jgi:choice-of-anchor B domain-containing protein
MSVNVKIVSVLAVASVLMVGVPAAAHDDEPSGSDALAAVQVEEFEGVVATKANPESNAPNTFAPCIRGMAAGTYPCDGIDMWSHLTPAELGLSFVNDMWGWTDPATGDDYALVGGGEGLVVVDISDPKRPDVIGILPTKTVGSFFWRDVKVLGNYAYVVSEDPGHGMQILDLSTVTDITGDPVTLTETAHYGEFGNAHNVFINTDTAYAYAVGTDTCAGGLHMIDLSAPVNPSFAGCFSDHAYVHDTQCVIYEGPDAAYRGREICFSSAADASAGFPPLNTVSIVDVTDKSNPTSIARAEYDVDGYSHQGWLSPDQQYFFHNDELDELFAGTNTVTRIWDMTDLDDPFVLEEVAHDNTSIGHNAYTEGRHLYAANYTSGLRIYDTTDAGAGVLPEVAYFDMYPENDNAAFEGGAWSNFPYFRQPNVVAVSSIDRGLFLLKPRIGS